MQTLIDKVKDGIQDARWKLAEALRREDLSSVQQAIENEVASVSLSEYLNQALQAQTAVEFRDAVQKFRKAYDKVNPYTQLRMPGSASPKKGWTYHYSVAVRKVFDEFDPFLIKLIRKSREFGLHFVDPSLSEIMVQVYAGTAPLALLRIVTHAIDSVKGDDIFKEP